MPTTALGRFTVTGTTTQIDSVRAALAACTYPVAEKLPRDIPVTFADLTRYQAAGLFWTDGRIEIERTLTDTQAQAVFLAEAWHAIDQYILTSGDRAALLTAAHDGRGPDGHTWFDNASYYADLGETMMDTFLAAYTPYPPTGIGWEHPVTGRLVDVLRGILSPPADDGDPLAGLPVDVLDAWAARRSFWWARYAKTAADAWTAWRT